MRDRIQHNPAPEYAGGSGDRGNVRLENVRGQDAPQIDVTPRRDGGYDYFDATL
jgi:hypothetical protein